jgi:hypothetical protein
MKWNENVQGHFTSSQLQYRVKSVKAYAMLLLLD